MPSKRSSRRTYGPSGTQRASYRSGRGSRDSGDSHGGKRFPQQAFLAVTAISLLAFMMVLLQIYWAVRSERGLHIGNVGFRIRLRGVRGSSGEADYHGDLSPSMAAAGEVPGSAAAAPLPPMPGQWQPPLPDLMPIPQMPLQKPPSQQPPPQPLQPQQQVPQQPLPPLPQQPQPQQTPEQAGRGLAAAAPAPPLPVAGIAGDGTLKPTCTWEEHRDVYLGGLSDGNFYGSDRGLAQEACMTMGEACKGVTCERADACTPRKGEPYLAPSPTGEVSFVKTQCTLPRPKDSNVRLAMPIPVLTKEQDLGPIQLRPRTDRKPLEPGRAALAIIAHDRPGVLTQCLQSVTAQSDLHYFTLAVSLDDPAKFTDMRKAVEGFKQKGEILIWEKPTEILRVKKPVYKIASHFKFALTQAFDVHHFEFCIFLETDLTLAPDALWYFRASAWLLEEDPSLFCISAWNDNGFSAVATDERQLLRTDYFPGLGWMLRNETWDLIRDRWPKAPTTGWDHWIRHASGLRPRECVLPEVSRTHHFDEHGTNVKTGNDIAKQLRNMRQSSLPPNELTAFERLLYPIYEEELHKEVRNAQLVASPDDCKDHHMVYKMAYVREVYRTLATRLQIYKSQPRGAHHGIVITREPTSQARLYLVDRRQSQDLLPPEEQWHPLPAGRIGAASPGESCFVFCGRYGMRCDQQQLEYVNKCSVLKMFFPCEGGCGHQVGPEIPSYVHDASIETALQCIVTDESMPTCIGAHKSTTRLCACVP